MTFDQFAIFALLAAVFGLFAWGRWRHDVVALLGLLLASLLGLVSAADAFSGFGNPAVITVAAVLVLSKGLMNSGMVDYIVRSLSRVGSNQTVQLGALVLGVTVCSAFMNNVGALALFMPVAIRMARKNDRSPSVFLMPIAFGSLLGGLITQIGTPPNILISAFRAQALGGEPFRMFDFAPVGASVALAGLFFIVAIGWRLIPQRKGRLSRAELFDIDHYITDVTVPPSSPLAGKPLKFIEEATKGDVVVVGHVRDGQRFPAPSPYRLLADCDTLIVKASAEELQELIDATGIDLAASHVISEEELSSEEVTVVEAIVTANSGLEGRSALGLGLRSQYGINLLGVSREGGRLRSQPGKIRLRVGDVLLLQGGVDSIQEALATLGCLPLAERGLRFGQGGRVALAVGIFAAAILVPALGIFPIQLSFVAAALAMVMTRFLSLREAYESIEGSVIVMLAAMIPVSAALESTGAAQLLADGILAVSGRAEPWAVLLLVLTATMLLSNIVNNAAAVLLMAPIALGISIGLGASADPFLMSAVVGASCAFMTPVGHQSNTLIMGPGGYRFGDYWRLGLPLSIMVAAVAVPVIIRVWPLFPH